MLARVLSKESMRAIPEMMSLLITKNAVVLYPEILSSWTLTPISTFSTRPQLGEAVLNGLFP
jgi:hypothetical protein